MGGISVPERSSLDRLKALDSLPTLEAQLQEAKSLCNHGARAEMILRWLMGKLKSSQEARKESACWELASSCFRILSTSRMAFLLGSKGFIDVLHATSSETGLPTEWIHTIANSLALLFQLSEKDNGASIKSLLSINSSIAATICGNWLRHIYHSCRHNEEESSTFDPLLFNPALRIWSLRRRSDSDDELFNSHCLVPSMLLLRYIHENEDVSSNKRKRGQTNESSAQGVQSALQSMVAKHTVLPARALHFKKNESRVRQTRARQAGADQPEIKERLSSMKMAILRGEDPKLVGSIPLLLDIALRSVATPTPRHRFNERPWIESLLLALRGCFAGRDRDSQNAVLAEMVKVLHHRGHLLSLQTLSAMVQDDAMQNEDLSETDWHLIAQIAKLDANVFCDRSLIDKLFNAITASQRPRPKASSGVDLGGLLKNDVLTPVMNAHAKSRTMATFIGCWSEQLLLPENQSAVSVWCELTASFAETCEEAMTAEQIAQLFEKLSSDVIEMANSLNGADLSESLCRLHAILTVLIGLLSGVRSDSTIARLQDGLQTLHQSLQALARSKSSKIAEKLPRQLWSLLTRVFDLWFPSWALGQDSRAGVVEKCLTKSLRGAFDTALIQCIPKDDSEDVKGAARSAQLFAATLCTCFGRYEEFEPCQRLCEEGVERLSQEGAGALPIFLKFPGVFVEAKSDSRRSLVYSLPESVDQKNDGLSVSFLQALMSAAASIPQRALLDDVIAATIDNLKDQRAERDSSNVEPAALMVLSAVDMAVLKQEQRVELLDTLLSLQSPQSTASGTLQLQQRLAMMVHILRHSCRGARLLTDAEGIWDVVGLFRSKVAGKKTVSDSVSLDSLENLEVFGELVKWFIGALLATQSQKTTREMLVKFSDQTKKRMQQLRNGKDVAQGTRTASLVLFKNVCGSLGKINEDPEATTFYFDALAAELNSIISRFGSDPSSMWASGCSPGPLLWILDALVALPDGLRPSPLRIELANAVKPAAYILLDWDDAGREEEGRHDRSKVKVASFKVACKYAPTAGRKLLPLAEKLLQRDLSAREYMTVLSAFEEVFKADDDEWTVALQELTTERSQSPAALILQQKAIKNLSDDDLEGSPTGTGYLRGTESFTAYQIFDHTLTQVSENANFQAKKIALQTLVVIFKEKSFMVNQYGIEQTLTALQNLLQTYQHASALYIDICNVFAALFAAHRSRLQGRFNLLVALFQALLTTLFTNTLSSAEISVRHAKLLARLLESFCNPQIRPRSTNNKKTTSLVDENRKAQARAGQYAQYIIHHYCSQLLTGTSVLREGVREALMPGLWVMIEAMESYNADGVKVLSAAMNNSERAVLRSVYEDWKRFGKWEGL